MAMPSSSVIFPARQLKRPSRLVLPQLLIMLDVVRDRSEEDDAKMGLTSCDVCEAAGSRSDRRSRKS